ncbi:MAG: hypothetical protein KTR13_04555 [Saprospiraceae bacterium]|nr:hypothetical protein [Saprospiraceae bacterium]
MVIELDISWKEEVFDYHPNSRAWVYQSNRLLSDAECSALESELTQFVAHWTAHGSQLTAKAMVLYNRFVVLVADESRTAASGCSIDASVHFLQKMEAQFDIQLFDRTQVAFVNANGQIETIHFTKVKSALQSGALSATSLIFNNSIATKAALTEQWLIPLEASWLKKYL